MNCGHDLSAKIHAMRKARGGPETAAAIEAVLDAIDADLGDPFALLKAHEGSLCAKLDSLQASIAKIQENDRRHADSLKLSAQRKPHR